MEDSDDDLGTCVGGAHSDSEAETEDDFDCDDKFADAQAERPFLLFEKFALLLNKGGMHLRDVAKGMVDAIEGSKLLVVNTSPC